MWIKGQLSKPNLLKQNIKEYLYDPGIGKDFLDRTQKALTFKENIDKLKFIDNEKSLGNYKSKLQ